ncbi:MAG TPA: hypothetical protein PLX25_08355 [Sphaerochaeta sp.]|nr:hypothetical protein [Sphaerochaeta sp.]
MDIDAARKALKECELRHKALARRIADIGFIWQGSVSERYLKCGKATCACKKDPDFRHGPYYYWTTKVAGKSVAKKLDGAHAGLLQEWVKNRIEMDSIIAEMREVSKEALEAALVIAEEEQAASKKPQE